MLFLYKKDWVVAVLSLLFLVFFSITTVLSFLLLLLNYYSS